MKPTFEIIKRDFERGLLTAVHMKGHPHEKNNP